MVHEFGHFTLDVDRKVLLCEGNVVSLGGRAVATLAVLIAAGGRVVGKDEILEAVWGDEASVEESNIAQHVYVLRRALRAHGIEGAIETIPRRGYRFVLPQHALRATASRRPACRRSASRLPPPRWPFSRRPPKRQRSPLRRRA